MLERVDGADTKVTYLVKFSTSQRIALLARGADKTQSKFISDLVDRVSRVEELDLYKLRKTIELYGNRWIEDYIQVPDDDISHLISEILSIFGIEEVGD
jgi:lipoate-protein ligase A